MANFVSRRQFTIEWSHCDPAGIVFNARFFEYFDWGTWTLFERAARRQAAGFGACFRHHGFAVGRCRGALSGAARFGERGRGDVASLRIPPFELRCRARSFRVGATLAVAGKETRVWAVRDPADPSKLKGQTIPPEVLAASRSASVATSNTGANACRRRGCRARGRMLVSRSSFSNVLGRSRKPCVSLP